MSQAPTRAGLELLKELDEICKLPAGPAKEAARKAWAEKLYLHAKGQKDA